MSGDEKLFGILMVCFTVAVLTLLGWGVVTTMNNHNFDLACLETGKTIQFSNLPGQGTAYKVCK